MIYEKIKIICKIKQIPISILEQKAGLSNGAISKWNKNSPTVKKLQAVCSVLEISIEEILRED